jgi:hypothetical protein
MDIVTGALPDAELAEIEERALRALLQCWRLEEGSILAWCLT